MVRTRTAPVRAALVLLGSLALAGLAVAQPEPAPVPDAVAQPSPLASVTGTLILNIIVGVLLITFADEYVEAMLSYVRENTLRSFLWGLGAFLALGIVIFILVITLVGILVALPLALLAIVVGSVGNVLTLMTVTRLACERLDRPDWAANLWALLAGSLLVSALVGLVPILGPVANFVIGTVGFGAVLSQFWTNR